MKSAFIKAIGVAGAETIIDNVQQGNRLGVEDSFVETKIGVKFLPELAADESGVSLALRAVEDLVIRSPGALEHLDAVIYVTQNPDHGGLPHNSAIMHGHLDLPQNVACFDVGLGCSGFTYGLGIISSMIGGAAFQKVLLVTCDPYRSALAKDDKNTNLLFGDWACATLVDTNGPWRIGKSSLETIGSDYKNLIRSSDGILMHGRAVFNFARTVVASSLESFCNEAAGGVSKVDLFLVHQGSKIVVDELRKKLGVDEDRMPFDIIHTGNAVSSSIPLLLAQRMDVEAKIIAACGFGVGLSIGNVLLHKE